MPLEITMGGLTKALTPIIAPVIKEGIKLFKDQRLKWSADASAKKLSKIIVGINTVKTVWSRDKGILIDDFYYPSQLRRIRSHSRNLEPNEVIFESSIIEGIVGQGKSILMRQLCNFAVESGIIPIFIELRMISHDRSLTNLITDFMEAAGIPSGNDIFAYLANQNKIVLILDGFDEIPSSFIKNTVYNISQLQKVHDELKIVISSRPSHAIQNLTGFHVHQLSELKDEDYEPFLRKIVHDPITRFNIQSAIVDAPENIRGVITTPLMLTLLVRVYQIETEIPATLPDFFEKLFSAVFIQHDGYKPGFEREHHSKLSASKLQKLFDAFCFMTLQQGFGRTLENSEFDQAFTRALKYTPASNCEIEGFRKDITNVACLMLDDGFEQVSFLHKSIMEYHAASFIQSSSDEFAAKFYDKAPIDYENWAETLSFLSYIDEYRYGQLYILENYPPFHEALTETLRKKTTESLIKFLNLTAPNFIINVSNSNFRSFTTDGTEKRHYFSDEIVYAIINNMRDQEDKVSKKTIHKATRETVSSKRGSLEINTKAMVENFDQSIVWTMLGSLEREILDTINKYQLIVHAEKRKNDIFD
ncbi:NACHT domain-containing protein [Pseudomonas sp. Z3-6]|uniref:NACHT domain-containing protein n=1 Tax=Pseudomonas sp. Z3-6 TaxID=2817411 RepID=UPI003DA8571A